MAREGLRERAADVYYGLQVMNVPEHHLRAADNERDVQAIVTLIAETRRAALLEIRQFCVDHEDCCVLGLVAHANKAVTDASISTMQFIKRHIDDRLAQEG